MSRFIVVLSLMFMIAGCSTTTENQGGKGRDTEIGFNLPNGSLLLVVDGDGNFVSVKSSGAAQVLSDDPSAKEAAVTVATARAKRTLAEFMSDQLSSSNAINQIVHATGEGDTYAQDVVEKIRTNSQALLRGAYTSRQSMEGDVALVEVTISRTSVSGSRSLRSQMYGN